MLNSVEAHYEKHLAPIYSWMVGDFDSACSNAGLFLDSIGLPAGQGRRAVDLGCGHGIYSIPLARRGYEVVGVDNSKQLLEELESAKGKGKLSVKLMDLVEFMARSDHDSVFAVVCMGDTLTHLASEKDVESMIADSARCLNREGWLVLSFRDYVTTELMGAKRFIPVRSDDQRIHTCFLEYQSERVWVHDVIHNRKESGWEMSVSAYPKLRLDPNSVVSCATRNGLKLAHESTDRGMLYLAFCP